MRKVSTTFLVMISAFLTLPATAQNLLNLQEWLPGSGGINTLAPNGQVSENTRVWGIGPHGQRAVLWKAVSDGGNNDDGGWDGSPISVNATAMYRFTVWIKKETSNEGTTYFGCTNVADLNGVFNSNPYFWFGDMPELNKWYLLVGYIHGSGDASTTHYGGIYDGQTGQKVLSCTDFKFTPTSNYTGHRSYLFYTYSPNTVQYFYAPRIDLVNGNEASVSELLAISNTGTTGATNFMGKVGIMTTTPGNYELAVNGDIRTQSIRVETNNWPDYVFDSTYQLMSLPHTEQFIKTHKHLPGIPSANKVQKEGVELGTNQALLLKKIEELTLHIIELEKRIAVQEEKPQKKRNQ